MLVTPSNVNPVAKIKVVGVGGAGGNAVNTMIADYSTEGVEFYAFNTDAQVLKNSLAPQTLQLGPELTRGLGVGGDHNVGAQAAEESLDEIHEHLAGADMVFLTAGMGGGTGTGAIPVIAGVAKNLGALTVAVVTKPFKFEGKHRERVAEEGLAELKDKVDTLIIVDNQRLLEIVDENISFLEAMKEVDKVLAEGVKSISSLVTMTGFINVDFADVKAIMTNAGTSLMGMGRASGDKRAETAARQAATSPLLDMSIQGAKGVLFNIVGGTDLSMSEINTAAQMIGEAVDPDAKVIFGATIDETMKDEIVITIVATGFDEAAQHDIELEALNVDSPARKLLIQEEPKSSLIDKPVQKAPQVQTPVNFTEVDSAAKEPSKPADDFKSGSDDDDLEIPAFMRRKN
ncbi:MAG: cell division protein FtsZ [Candidatus Dojkabacteria bacterium]|nr:MAG: cell division protein FtsZ [Candidatus Dojkabacteria bacterium]